MLYFCSGDMAEWSIAAVLKTVKPKGFGGSNPEMPEWSIGAVSKTVERFAFQGFESLSLRKSRYNNALYRFFY